MSNPQPPLPPLDRIPADIIQAADYEQRAAQHLSAAVLAHIAGGSGNELSLQANRTAFDRIQIAPRILQDCTAGNTTLNILGHSLRHPVLLAPVAFQTLIHPEGELATARAAEALDTCLVTSTFSSNRLEDIARANSGHNWFQLYWQPRRETNLDLVRRAEAAGYSALVITLDAPLQTGSRRARQAGFQLPPELRAANLQQYPQPQQVALEPDQSLIFQGMMREAPNWKDLDWLLQNCRLPVVAKGVLRPRDAVQLRDRGVSGIIVSNHGGRALDGAPASVLALPAIRAALGSAYPLLLDSGVRSGYDIFKALAAGANAVLIGRLQVCALAVAGALGVAHMLKLLRDELEICMAMAGCPDIASIDTDALFSAT